MFYFLSECTGLLQTCISKSISDAADAKRHNTFTVSIAANHIKKYINKARRYAITHAKCLICT